MRITSSLALVLVLAAASAGAEPKTKTAPRAKPPATRSAPSTAPAARPAPKQGRHSFSFSFSTSRGRLGVSVSSMTEELRDWFGASKDAGVLVQKVEPQSPADKAGVKVGDVITRVDGSPVDDSSDLSAAVAEKKSGEIVTLGVVRNKRFLQLTAKLESDPSDDGDFAFSFEGLGELFQGFGQRSGPGTFFRQWHWQWPPSRSGSSGDSEGSDAADFEKRLKELEKRFDELKKKGSGTQLP